MKLKFWDKDKDMAVVTSTEEAPAVTQARLERMHAEQLLVQTRTQGMAVRAIAGKSKQLLEANNFIRTIDLCMERNP